VNGLEYLLADRFFARIARAGVLLAAEASHNTSPKEALGINPF
jgi:hypothetical protein